MNLYVFDKDREHVVHLKEILAHINEGGIFRIYYNIQPAKLFERLKRDEECVILTDTSAATKMHNAFALCQMIRERSLKCHIIFMSNSVMDALLTMRNLLRPSGYIIKPVVKSELQNLLALIVRDFERRTAAISKSGDVIHISTRSEKYVFPVEDVLCFTTRGKRILCRTVAGNSIEFYGTLYKVEEKYSNYFLRCHSGFLINKTKVERLSKTGGFVKLFGMDENIPVSDKYKHSVVEFFNEMLRRPE